MFRERQAGGIKPSSKAAGTQGQHFTAFEKMSIIYKVKSTDYSRGFRVHHKETFIGEFRACSCDLAVRFCLASRQGSALCASPKAGALFDMPVLDKLVLAPG